MKQKDPFILSTAYFGPVQYFCRIASENPVIIEQYDHYSKQTYRNRCEIMGANGKLVLSIPVKKLPQKKTWVKDIRIDYDTNWQKIHLRGIISSYKSSPFFEFYFDDLEWVFQKRTRFLIDLNQDILKILIDYLGINKKIILSEKFINSASKPDLRDLISPKKDIKKDPYFKPVSYTQVFSTRHGFIENLSILDLIFNTGPESINILKKSFTDKT